jgi:hypothetical protein
MLVWLPIQVESTFLRIFYTKLASLFIHIELFFRIKHLLITNLNNEDPNLDPYPNPNLDPNPNPNLDLFKLESDIASQIQSLAELNEFVQKKQIIEELLLSTSSEACTVILNFPFCFKFFFVFGVPLLY